MANSTPELTADVAPTTTETRLRNFLNQLDERLERLGEWLNPILVKESRQAMKSRQFSITFTLLLTFGIFWSYIGIAFQLPQVAYVPGGQMMLLGYLTILLVPMLLVIPFAAYRSLAAEREDGTYELLAITTLSARKVVAGKLGSVVLQMMVYYSAIGPCIAFTYLLRGVDLVVIAYVMTVNFLLSLFLSLIGLFLASVTRGRHWQLLISVVMILGCGAVGWTWGIVIWQLIAEQNSLPFAEPQFWIGMLVLFTAYVSYFVIVFLATEALNNFAAENRSTSIRIAILVQLGLVFGWIMYALQMMFDQNNPSFDVDFFHFVAVWVGIHWFFYGALMTGEHATLSPRVLRQLPRTTMGRLLTAWLYPGPGTGYVFTVTGFGFFLLSLLGVALFGFPFTSRLVTSPWIFAGILWGYFAFFLGLGYWILRSVRKYVPHGFMFPLLLHVILLLLAVAIPMLAEAFTNRFQSVNQYSLYQVGNWFWTLIEATGSSPTIEYQSFPLVFLAGGLMYLGILFQSRDEVVRVRRALPQRVAEDEQAQQR